MTNKYSLTSRVATGALAVVLGFTLGCGNNSRYNSRNFYQNDSAPVSSYDPSSARAPAKDVVEPTPEEEKVSDDKKEKGMHFLDIKFGKDSSVIEASRKSF